MRLKLPIFYNTEETDHLSEGGIDADLSKCKNKPQMKVNKLQIFEYDPVIYPFKLWVAITSDINSFSDKFKHYPSGKKYKIKEFSKLVAFVDTVSDIETEKIGFLVVFKSYKECSAGCMAHEATHVSDRAWSYLGEVGSGKESNAYLVEWVVDCIERVKLGKTI